MGMGDILMSMGEARELHARTRQPVLIVGRDGRPIDNCGLFNGIPYLLTSPTNKVSFQKLINGPGVRPYIRGKTPRAWTWKAYTPKPAEIKFTPDELAFADRYRGRVMVEPRTKNIGHSNKAWPDAKWSELLGAMQAEGIPTIQCGPGGTQWIADRFALTPSFRYAAAVLSVSKAFVGTEGGLMHAAAAVGVPGVILWSEFIGPESTGYAMHKNLRHATRACGMRVDCPSCAEAMNAITVDEVLQNLKGVLNEIG